MKYLLERKNYGELYHFSTLINIFFIVKENRLEGGEGWFSNKNPKYDDFNVISLTRNKRFSDLHKHFPKSHIIFDGEKLTDKYKVVPHDFFHFYNTNHNKGKNVYEFEESILLKGKRFIEPNKYIIDIHTGSFEEFYDHFRDEIEPMDYDTQMGRVIHAAELLDLDNIPTIDQLDKDNGLHRRFMERVYSAIIDFIKQ